MNIDRLTHLPERKQRELHGKLTVVDDHQEIVIRQIAAFPILDPVSAGVGTE